MTRAAGRAFTAAVLGTLVSAAWLALFYTTDGAVRTDFDRDPPRLVRGVHPPEYDDRSGLTFAWTQRDMALRLPGLDRSVEWTWRLRLRAARPDASNPDLAFHADGLPVHAVRSPTDFEVVTITIPPRPERRRGAVLSMQVSATFVPGAGDPRELGVQVDWMEVSPAGLALPPRSAFAGAAAASAALGAAVALTGVTAGSAVGAAILLSAAAAAQISRGFGPHSAYPESVATAGIWIALALALGTAVAERWRRSPLRNTARFAAAFSAGVLFFTLLVVLHPDMPVGDAMFHAHRFQGVLAGHLYFTSTAPGNYLFPYAPGLYVVASPFAGLVARGPADMTLLRVVVLATDAAAGLLLYWMVAGAWRDRRAGAVAVAVYHLMPQSFSVVTTGNLTNAFAQSVAVCGFALMAQQPGSGRAVWMAALAVALGLAFLSHTSTFAIVATAAVLIAGLFRVRGDEQARQAATGVIIAALAAVAIAIALYYAHFMETYRSEFARIAGETATGAADAGGRGIAQRLLAGPYYLRLLIGVPALVLGVAGGVRLWQQPGGDRLTLVVAGWALACGGSLVLGIVTPVDFRHYLAAMPAVAVAAGAGSSFLWTRWRTGRLAVALLLSWMVWLGTLNWWGALAPR